MKFILCLLLGHTPVLNHDKDMFGNEYVWQRVRCKRCGKKIS